MAHEEQTHISTGTTTDPTTDTTTDPTTDTTTRTTTRTGRGPVADASVRVARGSDAPAVGLVQAVVFREAYAAVLAPEVLATFEPRAFANAWRATLEGERSGDGVLLVACAGEQVVGFAAVGASDDADTDAGTAELIVLGVHPDARRQGHGSRLLHAVVDTARGSWPLRARRVGARLGRRDARVPHGRRDGGRRGAPPARRLAGRRHGR